MSADDLPTELAKWFSNAHISRIREDNMREWLCWAFCAKYLEEASVEERSFIDEALNALSQKMRVKFLPGHNPDIKGYRLTLDRVEGMSRPLIFYLVTSGMGFLMDLLLSYWGFEYNTSGKISYWILLPPQSTKPKKDPIVFVHGIGVGLASYIPFLWTLRRLSKDKGVALILPTLPHVSMGLIRKEFPGRSATVEGLVGIFERHNLEKGTATWIGHSLGSVIVGWVCKARKDLIGRVALVDPVCFRLWEADVCYNFVYKMPTSGDELLMWYFVAREMGVSAALGRGFWWFQNVIFPESLPKTPLIHVYLGACDKIVNSPRVYDYLKENAVPVTVFKGLGHGATLVASTYSRKRVLDFIGEQ